MDSVCPTLHCLRSHLFSFQSHGQLKLCLGLTHFLFLPSWHTCPHPFTRSVGGDKDVRWVTCGNISLDLAPGATHFQIQPPYRAKPARRGQWMIDNWEETAYQTSWCKVAELIFDCLKPVSSPLECIYVGSCQNHALRLREIVMRQLAWNDLQGFLFHISTDGWLMAHAALSLILSLNHTTFELVSDSYYGGELMP